MNKIERAMKTKEKLAKECGVPITSIVWIGGKKFIVVKNGMKIIVETK